MNPNTPRRGGRPPGNRAPLLDAQSSSPRGRGRGRGGAWVNRPVDNAGATRSGSPVPRGVCRSYWDTGTCRFELACAYRIYPIASFSQ